MKIPPITKINNLPLLDTAGLLPHKGKLLISEDNLTYLDIDDNFVHQLFPLIKNPQVKKPNYFGGKLAGAHVSIIYADENVCVNEKEVGIEHSFTIKEFVAAEIGPKTYYVLLVKSPSLLALRCKYHLPDMLNFKGYSIDFHITVGVT